MPVGRRHALPYLRSWTNGAATVAGGQALIALMSSSSIVITARALGAHGRGEVTMVQAMVGLAVAVGILGLPVAIVRSAKLESPRKAIAFLYTFAVVSSSSLGAFIVVVYSLAKVEQPAATIPVATLVALAGVVQVSSEAYAASLQRGQQFNRLTLARVAWSGGSMIALAGAALLTRNVMQSLYAWALGQALVLLLIVLRDKRMIHTLSTTAARSRVFLRRPRSRSLATIKDPAIRDALRSNLSLLLLMLVFRVDVLVIALASTPDQVGLYTIAYAAAEVAWMYANGHAVTLMAQALTVSPEERARLLREATIRSVWAAVLVIAAVGTSGAWLIPLIFGEEFSGSYAAFMALCPGVVLFIAYKLRSTLLLAEGKPAAVSRTSGLLLVVNIALTYPLASEYGAIGAASATSVTYMLGAALLGRLKA